mgnify:CR=1 FL=1
MRIPEWIIEGLKEREKSKDLLHLLKGKGIATICEEAKCPNIGTCFNKKTATFLIMGTNCTRNCRFCAVHSGRPQPLDMDEPRKVAETVRLLGIKHIVITSVTRDDLEDGGADHFVNTIGAIREMNKGITIEVLIPDFNGNFASLDKVIASSPEVINHNIETVKEFYKAVRPKADYYRSLEILSRTKRESDSIVTKSGMMVGLGETEKQVYETMDDLLNAGVEILTIGQYLRPTREHLEVKKYVAPEEFDKYRETGLKKGFLGVASGPFVRSSYHAKELFEEVYNKIPFARKKREVRSEKGK